jgi:predicted dehydrogenase
MAKTFRAAVIGRTGHGNYGHGLDTVWNEVPGVELVAVADDDKAGLAAAVKRLGVEQGFLDYREMLDKVKPDVVTIAQRWVDRHAEMAQECAARGVHMYMEKPLCASLVEADAMVAACERTHVKLAVGHITRYSPLIDVVKQLIAEGKIGRVLEYRARGKEDRRGGAEDAWVLGSHMMNLIRTFGGSPNWCFATIRAGGKPITRADVVEGNEGLGPLAGDAFASVYGMPNDALASFASVRGAGGGKGRFALQICGSAGIIEVTSNYHPQVSILEDPSWSPERGKGAWKPVSSNGVGKPETITGDVQHAGGNQAVAKDLLAAIEENRQPLCSVYEARAAVEMIVAAFESQRVGGPVTFPLATRVNPLALL